MPKNNPYLNVFPLDDILKIVLKVLQVVDALVVGADDSLECFYIYVFVCVCDLCAAEYME